LNPQISNRQPSATLTINERTARLAQAGRQLYRFGFGQSPFPVPAQVVEALQANAAQKDYLPVRGLPALREAVADFHRRHDGLTVSRDDVLIGPGSKELMFLAQLAYHAELVVPSPAWVSYAPQAQVLGLPVHWLPTRQQDGWRLQPEVLAAHCRANPQQARLLILNYPSNPTGLTLRADELQALAEVARQYRVVVLSDEIYGELHHTGAHISLARYYPEGTIISSGLSKWCGAGGWRLGTFVIPPSLDWLRDAIAVAASETFSTVSAPIQHAAVAAFAGGAEIERYLFQARRIIRALGNWVSQQLQTAGVDVAAPEGGFYLLPDFTPQQEALRAKGIESSLDFCEQLLQETGVVLLPGTDFGRPSAELTCRLAYVDFDGERSLAAAEAIPDEQELSERFLREYCGSALLGIETLCEWLR
jgi:aspartate aminotransferase